MITISNRHNVTNRLQRLVSAAEYFSAFTLARTTATCDIANELRSWSAMKANEFDEQFKLLAKELGYSVKNSEEAV